MKSYLIFDTLILGLSLQNFLLSTETAQAQEEDLPTISILWPTVGADFGSETFIKIKSAVNLPNEQVDQVQFFAGSKLIGVVTNAPFNLVWPIDGPDVRGPLPITAVLFDKTGLRAESVPVEVFYSGTKPIRASVQIASPRNGEVFPVSGTFSFSAEVLATSGSTGPLEFLIDTNLVTTVPSPGPFTREPQSVSVTVSNLAQGEHRLKVRMIGHDSGESTFNPVIRVVQLGIGSADLLPDGRIAFEVITSFPGKSTVIQTSTNLSDWLPISTNLPASNYFNYTDPAFRNGATHWYRAVVLAD